MSVTPPGRHRAPGRFNPLTDLAAFAKQKAHPAFTGAAIVAATSGLVASIAPAAQASETGTVAAAAPKTMAAAVVGPEAAPVDAGTDLSLIGFKAPASPKADAKKKAAKPEPKVIKDVVVLRKRAEAKKKAEAAAAAKAKAEAEAAAKARAEQQARASRSTSRESLTNSTATTKSTTNTQVATAGGRSAYNWGSAGQCTWGALNKWKQSEGYYPGGWTGNAEAWAYGARNAGYTVSSTPRTRSILVMQAGVHGSSSVGHVAWVTAVNGNQVTIIEMNALAGPYNYNTRTLTQQSGMQYIYAP